MKLDQVEYGQRVRVNMPGVGDHGKAGIIKRVRGLNCYVHLDWDQRPERQVVFSAAHLDLESTEPAPADVTR